MWQAPVLGDLVVTRSPLALLLALALPACTGAGSLGNVPPIDDDDDDDDGVPVLVDGLLEVEIAMDPDDEAEMRVQSRDFLEVLRDNCTDEIQENPYTWFEGDVVVGGVAVDRVGVRKKGFIGSLSEERPSIKLKFDKYVLDQTLDGDERLTLNNNRQDPATLRTCLAYHVFSLAGVPAPTCSYATVDLNGDDLGVYSNVQPVKRAFLKEHFGDSDGDLYEGNLTDFREGWLGSFEAKTSSTDPEGPALQALADALLVPDAELRDALEGLLDIDAYIRFWAAETIVGHWDGYAGNTNNFFVYRNPVDGLLHFIPWGTDGTFGDGWEGETPIYLQGRLAQRIYGTSWGRAAYVDELAELFDTVWDEEALHTWIDEAEAVVGGRVSDPWLFSDGLDGLRWNVSFRRDRYADFIASGGWDLPTEPRPDPCLQTLGTLDMEFATTWGTLGQPPFESGSSDWDLLVDGVPSVHSATGGVAGYGEKGQSVVAMFGMYGPPEAPVGLDILYVVGPPDSVRPGGLELDLWGNAAYLLRAEPPDSEAVFIGYAMGSLTYDEAGTFSGAAVTGELTTEILGPASE